MNPHVALSPPRSPPRFAAGRPVVALETTIVSHGMPWPDNLETALAVEAVVRDAGAVPAAIAVIGRQHPRRPRPRSELERLAQAKDVLKLSSADIAYGLASGRTGATTVAATMIAAHLAGIGVFATGGIGGVHRGAETSFDISADLTELARTPVTVVCAGAKALLDLPKTLEVLETLGVPVVATGSDAFPAFWSRDSGLPAPIRLDAAAAIAGFMRTRAELGQAGGMLVANPVPEADEIPAAEMAPVIAAAVADAAAQGHHRQGGDAVPARRDLSPHRRPQPCHQHRAGQEQRPAGGRDRRGAGGGPAPRPRLTTTRGGGRNETLTHKTVAVSDGTALHYIETGEGRPLLLVPGWSQSAAEFVHQIDAFAKFARVFAIDMRGHGESAKPKNGYRVQRLAKDLYDVIVRLGLEEPDVLGHSMGSSVIWAYLSMFGDERPLGRLIIADQAPATVAQPDWDAQTIADAGSAFADFGVLATFEGQRHRHHRRGGDAGDHPRHVHHRDQRGRPPVDRGGKPEAAASSCGRTPPRPRVARLAERNPHHPQPDAGHRRRHQHLLRPLAAVDRRANSRRPRRDLQRRGQGRAISCFSRTRRSSMPSSAISSRT